MTQLLTRSLLSLLPVASALRSSTHQLPFHRSALSLSAMPAARPAASRVIVWFRNDLRIHDNECLSRASAIQGAEVIPLYCFDPITYGTSPRMGIPRTGTFRAQFIRESVADLRGNLRSVG